MSSFGQTNKTATIKVNGDLLQGKISIQYDSKTIQFTNQGRSNTYAFSEVTALIIEDHEYVLRQTATSGVNWLTPIISGNAVLFQDPLNDYYLKTESTRIRKLDLGNLTTLRGELLVMFSDCGPVRDRINNLSRIYSSTINDLTKQYNNCNYSQGFVLSEGEVKGLEEENDFFSFYLGTGFYSNSITMSQEGGKNDHLGLLISAGLKLSPAFIRTPQDNLSLTLGLEYLTETESLFEISSIESVVLTSKAYKILGGLQFAFNKKSDWQPYIGLDAGMLSSDYDFTYYKNGTRPEDLEPISSSKTHLNFIVEPEIGITYQLSPSGALNLSFSYFFKEKNNFSSSDTFTVSFDTETTGFSGTLRYIFL